MQRGVVPVRTVQIFHPPLKQAMWRRIQQMPIEAAVVIPFSPLPEFTSHKQQLFAWLGVHISKQQAQVGKLLPVIAWHLSKERTFPVHHLVMGQRQDKLLRKSVEHPKCEGIVI